MERLPPIARAHLQRQPNSDHLDADLLAAFAEQLLPPHERQQVLEHLSRCAQCREVSVLAGAEPEDALREPEFEMVGTAAASPKISQARAEAPSPVRKRWFGHPPARWFAVAACAVLCATLAVRYPTLWRGKQSELASKKVPPDSIAYNRPTDTASNFVQPQAAQPLAKRPALEPANSRSAMITRSPAAQERRVTEHAPLAQLAAPAVSSAAPASGLDRNAPLTQKAAAPHAASTPRMAPQAIPAPTGFGNAFRAPAGTARGAARGAPGGVPGGAHGGVLGGVIGGVGASTPQQSSQTVTIAAAVEAIQPQWSLSEDGIPQRSDDSGHRWQKIAVDASVQFRALYADQQEVWVGGPAGVLYHSSDMGAHWTRVRPADGATTLSADIARIDFKDPLHGDVTTAKGGIWTTADGGVSWLRH